MIYRIGGSILAVVVVVASLPLSLLAMERGFGLGATLTVPTACLGFWFSLVAPRRAQRIGWFAFSTVCTALLPMSPWWQRLIEAVLNWVQNYLRGSQPTVLYSAAETVALFLLIVLPWGVGGLAGWVTARLTINLLHHSIENESRRSGYRFTLRGMLVSMMVCAAQTAWLSSTVRQWHSREATNQAMFLQRFTHSFTSGDVKLLADPEISEDHTILKASQNSSGISEYRVIAPIEKHGQELWAVWTFLCDERYPGTVSKFAYAEALTQNGLPSHPFPVTEYLQEPTYTMIDGEPQLTMQATILNAPTVAKAGDTITIVAKTDKFLECNLVISPFQAITLPPAKITAPETGIISWDVKLNPAYLGTRVEYEFHTRTNVVYRAKTVNGTVTLDKIHSNKSNITSQSR